MAELPSSVKFDTQLVTSTSSLTVARTTKRRSQSKKLMVFSAFLFLSLAGSHAYSVDSCEVAFASSNYYKLFNKAARAKPGQDQRTHDRSLDEYNRLLTTVSTPKALNLVTLVPVNGLAIDSAGGSGLAFHQLATKKGLHSLVVNAQDFRSPKELDPQDLFYGSSFTYRKGYSEEVLKEYKGQASLITDVRGAFTDSPAKRELLETYYDALTSTGNAIVVYTSKTTPIRVRTADGGNQDLAQWLVEKYPTIFSVERSADPENRHTLIIRMKRDPNISDLKLPLTLASIDTRDFSQRSLGEPTILYVEQ